MHHALVGIFSNDRRTIRLATRALASAGAKVEAHSLDPKEVDESLNPKADLYLLDTEAEPGMVKYAWDRMVSLNCSSRVLVLASDIAQQMAHEILDDRLNHIHSKHRSVNLLGNAFDEVELIVTCQKLISGQIFGLEKYLALNDLDIHEHILKFSRERGEALKNIEVFLDQIDCYEGLRAVILTVADELLMNAIFNAPRNQNGEPKYRDRDRRDDFELRDREQVTTRYACDGKNVVLSVSDNFGSITRDEILRYLGDGLAKRKGRLEENRKAGGGLGLFFAFNSTTQLVFNIEVGQRTEIIATFYVRNGIRGLRETGPSLNLFLKSPNKN